MKDIPMVDPVTELKKLFDAKKFDAAIEFCQKLLKNNPNDPISWAPFGLPSLWVWQFGFLAFGIFVMWFLAFYMELSEPIPPGEVERVSKKYFK